MKKILIISLILGLAIAGLFAQMHMMGNKKGAMNHQGKGPMMNCMDELNLTEAQITKFAEARAAFQKQENVLSAEIENLRIDAMAAMKAEDFKRVKEIQKTISDKELMIKNAHVDMMAAHMKELSKEQKQIMQKNWMHLQDGTADGETFDLTITSTDIVTEGNIATFEGIIALKKDFGSGYYYEIIMEEATPADVELYE